MSSQDVAIFWDYENCHPPSYLTGYEIVKKIRLISHNFGTIKLFKAYLELSETAASSRSLGLRSELQSSGLSLTDCPHNGRKDVADKMILVDMLAYAIDNPAPSTIILISGDRDFAYAVSILRLRRYRVVIISLPSIHVSLKTQASVFLDWSNDVLGAEVDDSPSLTTLRPQNEGRGRQVSPLKSRYVKKNMPSNTSTDEFDAEAPDIDIMDHLIAHRRNGLRPQSFEQAIPLERVEDFRQPISPSHRSQTSYSHGKTDSQVEPDRYRTEFSPVAFHANDMSPTLVDSIRNSPSNVTPIVSQGHGSPILFIQDVKQPVQQRSGTVVDIVSPLATPKSGSISIASTRDFDTVLVPTSPPPTAVPPVTLPTPAPVKPPTLTSATPVPDVTLSAEPAVVEQPKVVPPGFGPLVERLEYHRLKGFPRPLRSGIAVELSTKDHKVYQRAGVERFGKYTEKAEKIGIIELGGLEGGAWIGLRPEWYGAKLT